MSWTDVALAALSAAARDGGWGYRPGSAPSAEPTALATLALVTHGRAPGSGFLARIQQADGAVGLSAQVAFPHWPTALAVLAWLADGGEPERIARACDFLLGLEGTTFRNDGSVGQNTELVGWPWVANTHSWLEPTAYALLALLHAGRGDHPRIAEARRVIFDRICAGGGWNYGCPAQLGSDAQAFPAPTGIALLALRDRRDDPRLTESIAFLATRTAATRSPLSLPWGLLGLAAVDRLPPGHEAWLAESYDRCARHGGGFLETSLLLLAARAPAALALIAAPEEGR